MGRWNTRTCWRWTIKVASFLGVTVVSIDAGNAWSTLDLDRVSLCKMVSAGEVKSQGPAIGFGAEEYRIYLLLLLRPVL